MIEKILNDINFNNLIEESPYKFNGQSIPRVSHILSNMLHEEGLMKWANAIGMYKRANYVDERDRAAFIGTLSHDNIEKYIRDNAYDLDSLNLEPAVYKKVNNAVESFIKWFSDINQNHFMKILGIEQQVLCPWYGGTYDMKMQVDDKIYLVDFKTSNHIGYRYFLQLAAYYYILRNQGEKIDGFIILQVDKNKIAYEEYTLLLDKPEGAMFMEQCIECFLSLVYAYYNRIQVENKFKELFK